MIYAIYVIYGEPETLKKGYLKNIQDIFQDQFFYEGSLEHFPSNICVMSPEKFALASSDVNAQ